MDHTIYTSTSCEQFSITITNFIIFTTWACQTHAENCLKIAAEDIKF